MGIFSFTEFLSLSIDAPHPHPPPLRNKLYPINQKFYGPNPYGVTRRTKQVPMFFDRFPEIHKRYRIFCPPCFVCRYNYLELN